MAETKTLKLLEIHWISGATGAGLLLIVAQRKPLVLMLSNDISAQTMHWNHSWPIWRNP
jgi:hypothetical protein